MPHPAVIITGLLCCAGLLILPDKGSAQLIELPTSQTALLGRFARGPVDWPVEVGATTFDSLFGSADPAAWPAEVQARQFFANGGNSLHIVRVAPKGPLNEALSGRESDLTGLHALEPLSNLRLLLAPELSLLTPMSFASTFGRFRAFLEPRRVFFILDPPPGLAGASAAVDWVETSVPTDAAFCAVYYPYLQVLQNGASWRVPASGAMAAVYAKSDSITGIWRSPAGSTLSIAAQTLFPSLGASDLDLLNTHHVNSLRTLIGSGIVPWGARTLDRNNSDNLYVSLVRTRGWIAASLERALAFAATQKNNQTLWDQILISAGTFLNSLYQRGAFAGITARDAYFAKCDASTITAADLAAHRVNLLYGVAWIRPAEFDLQQLTASTSDLARPVPTPAIVGHVIAGTLALAYPTQPGFTYTLESSPSLRPGTWTAETPGEAGDGAWRRPVLPMATDNRFYRLRVTAAP